MKIDFSKLVNGLDGQPFQVPTPTNPAETKALLAGAACADALLNEYQGESLTGPLKYARYQLAAKVIKNELTEVTAEEIVEIKNVIAKRYPAAVVGPIYDILAAVIPEVTH